MRKRSLSLWVLAGCLRAQEMIAIPGGDCPLGVSVSHEEAHQKTVAPFRIAKFPVTNEEYKRFVDETSHAAPETGSLGGKYRLWNGRAFPAEIARQPVVNVTWHDAVAYTQWLSKQSGRKYRLPTEEEWELAARGGLKGKSYPWGDTIDKQAAWHGQSWNGPRTLQNVDYGKPNGYGLYGMAGNIWQWVEDWYVPVFNDRPVAEELLLFKVMRGGSWNSEADFLKVNYRNHHPPGLCDVFIGFRVAMPE